jgi:dihydroxyacetone kinase-like predicted kinase
MAEKLQYKYDTQMLIDGKDLSEDAIRDYITSHIEGDCLLAVGDDTLIKIHFHTNTPWKVLEYASSLGDVYDVDIENMQRQEDGLEK